MKSSLLPNLFVTFLFFLNYPSFVSAQTGSCDNAGFELGTPEGYLTYTGTIDPDGRVVINTLGLAEEQHRVMRITDGFDPIAAENCTINNELRVVPEGAGQYAMRLGNEDTGSEAERVVLRFHVTPDRSFFLLSYAVVLNDPGHRHFEQPRFELRILSSRGEILDCGEYVVRAGEDLEGFENCNDWRVRPWTTAGFELQSYLGQDIQIEILTTDCSRGGHAGYAYFDASCRPLELQLEGYCPGTTSARLIATEGFERYQWSTGGTTNAISIDNPAPGSAYSVTVTSATGCTLVLSDTLPPSEVLPPPSLDPLADTTICPGNGFWVNPTGENFSSVFSPTIGYSADSFLISPLNTTTYSFTVADDYGCNTDTLFYTVTVDTLSTRIDINSVLIDSTSCSDTNDGAVEVRSNATALNWDTGDTLSALTGLAAGNYLLRLTDDQGCFIDREFTVLSPAPLTAGDPVVDSVACFGEQTGAINLRPEGGTAPYELVGETGPAGLVLRLAGLTSGRYRLRLRDANGCTTDETFFVPEPAPLAALLSPDSTACFGDNSGSIAADISGGVEPYLYRWDDPANQQTEIARNLSAGAYSVVVTDRNGCRVEASANVAEPSQVRLLRLRTDSTSCFAAEDGAATATPTGGAGGYTYVWSDPLRQSTQRATGLRGGAYELTITDSKGCAITEQLTVPRPDTLEINLRQDSISCFGAGDGRVWATAAGGNGGYRFFRNAAVVSAFPLDQLSSGPVRVSVRDRKGCEESETITVGEPAALTAMVTQQDYPDCRAGIPGRTTIQPSGGNGAYRYRWDTGDTGSTVSSFSDGSYAVTVTDAKGCSFTQEFSVLGLEAGVQAEGPFINAARALCVGSTLDLFGRANVPIDNYRWRSSQELPCDNCDQLSLVPGDSARYQLIVEDLQGCRDTAEVFIPVNSFQASLTATHPSGMENFLCFGEEVELAIVAEPPWTDIAWADSPLLTCLDCPEVTVRPTSNSAFRVRVAHDNGCTSLLETTLRVNRNDCQQYIPTAFSPNADGINEVFRIPSSRSIDRIVRMEVFDRYGGQLYLVEDVPFADTSWGWSGESKGKPANPGVYVYLFEVEYFDGSRDVLAGSFTLLR
ncbi:MAG: gliding motility-associated C-terminal domain-containing protein [Bacteroidota bacterium]